MAPRPKFPNGVIPADIVKSAVKMWTTDTISIGTISERTGLGYAVVLRLCRAYPRPEGAHKPGGKKRKLRDVLAERRRA